jgi:hypothetical protein
MGKNALDFGFGLANMPFCRKADEMVCGYSSGVERNLAKVEVARSNRVTRSILSRLWKNEAPISLPILPIPVTLRSWPY